MGLHGNFCFFSGNGGSFRAGSTITNGPLTIVPVGCIVEALEFFNECNTGFTGGHSGSGSGQSGGRHQSDHHHQCQQEAENSLLHGINLLFPILL